MKLHESTPFIRTDTFAWNNWDFLHHATENIKSNLSKWFSYQLFIPLYKWTSSNYTWNCSFFGVSLHLTTGIHQEIKSRSNSGNDYQHPVQNILPFSFNGCETSSVTLGHNIDWLLKDRVIRIFRRKSAEITGSCRKLCNVVLCDL